MIRSSTVSRSSYPVQVGRESAASSESSCVEKHVSRPERVQSTRYGYRSRKSRGLKSRWNARGFTGLPHPLVSICLWPDQNTWLSLSDYWTVTILEDGDLERSQTLEYHNYGPLWPHWTWYIHPTCHSFSASHLCQTLLQLPKTPGPLN